MITSFCAIFKPYETSSEISGGLSVGDLIGAEVGGTMGIMIRDDHPVEGADAGIIIANHTTAGSPVRVRSFLFLWRHENALNSTDFEYAEVNH